MRGAETVDDVRGGSMGACGAGGGMGEGAGRRGGVTASGIAADDAGALRAGGRGGGHVEVLATDGSITLSATVEGAIQPLVRALGTLELTDLVLAEPDLEESVLKMYSSPADANPDDTEQREAVR